MFLSGSIMIVIGALMMSGHIDAKVCTTIIFCSSRGLFEIRQFRTRNLQQVFAKLMLRSTVSKKKKDGEN